MQVSESTGLTHSDEAFWRPKYSFTDGITVGDNEVFAKVADNFSSTRVWGGGGGVVVGRFVRRETTIVVVQITRRYGSVLWKRGCVDGQGRERSMGGMG